MYYVLLQTKSTAYSISGSVTLVDGCSSVPVQDSDSTGTQSVINDCFDCLTCIVGVHSNRSALVNLEVPEVLCRILERKSHGLLHFKDCVLNNYKMLHIKHG